MEPNLLYKSRMISKHQSRLDTLFELAKELEPAANARVAAGLYIKNELVAIGWNQIRTSPFAVKYAKNSEAIYLHAETHAIKQALRLYSVDDLVRAKTTLYVVRAKRASQAGDFIWGLSKPCMGCARSVVDFGIKRIVYSLDEINGERLFEELP